MEHLGETTRALGDVIAHMYTPADEGYKAVVGYRAVQEEGFTGYVNHLREALVKGVIADAAAWQRQVRALDDHVQRFKAARLRYDYYSKKVDEIRTGLSAAAEKGKDLTQLHDRLQRNLIKLDEVKLEYDRASKDTCSALNKAWQERIPILTALLTRLVRFEESKHSHCLSQAFGLSQLLGTSAAAAAAALEAAWVGSNGGVRTGAGDAEAYLPMDAVKHHEGPLLRKGTVMKTKIYCRLVGSLLHAYDFSDENCSASATGCNHGAVLLEPRAVYDVTGVENAGEAAFRETSISSFFNCSTSTGAVYDVTGVENAGEAAFRVQVDGGKELLLAALTPEEGPAWGEALARAASWDAQACLAHMSQPACMRAAEQAKCAAETLREHALARCGVFTSLALAKYSHMMMLEDTPIVKSYVVHRVPPVGAPIRNPLSCSNHLFARACPNPPSDRCAAGAAAATAAQLKCALQPYCKDPPHTCVTVAHTTFQCCVLQPPSDHRGAAAAAAATAAAATAAAAAAAAAAQLKHAPPSDHRAADAAAAAAVAAQLKRAVQTFREEARARRGDPSLPEVERALGVTAALARPSPPPPPGMPPPLEPPQRLSLTAGTAPPRQGAVSLGGSLKTSGSAFFARGAAAEVAAARDGGDRGGASSGNGVPAAEEAETRRGIVRRLTGLSPFNRHSGGGGSTKDMASSTAIAGTVYAASGGGGGVSLSRRSSESTGGSGAVTACISPVARTESVATVSAAAPPLHGAYGSAACVRRGMIAGVIRCAAWEALCCNVANAVHMHAYCLTCARNCGKTALSMMTTHVPIHRAAAVVDGGHRKPPTPTANDAGGWRITASHQDASRVTSPCAALRAHTAPHLFMRWPSSLTCMTGGDATTADLHSTARFSSAPPGLAQPTPPPLPPAQAQHDSSPPPALQPYTEADPAHVREAFTALVAAAAARANSAAAAAAATAAGGTAAAAWTYSGGTGTGRRSSGSSAGSGGGGGACSGITLGAVLEWAEVRDLLHEGWVTEARVRASWAAARDARGPVPLSAAAQGVGADALDLAGFVLFVQLMEELRLEAELAANHGLVLADAAAVCVAAARHHRRPRRFAHVRCAVATRWRLARALLTSAFSMLQHADGLTDAGWPEACRCCRGATAQRQGGCSLWFAYRALTYQPRAVLSVCIQTPSPNRRKRFGACAECRVNVVQGQRHAFRSRVAIAEAHNYHHFDGTDAGAGSQTHAGHLHEAMLLLHVDVPSV
ncbi:hypothetical protein JKP88DRAFT_266555 [Tribonema minus]|uniref:PH domain-containing protein n=1 Tax=Tribonema minus TaxID=303371 RepID=A0A835ZFV6_9STRA|nr:hypothetical protein JKP88DRAFT_266555 [Tribonema minus]